MGGDGAIEVTPGDGEPYGVELIDQLTIGRAPDNKLVLDESGVSRYHAEIRRVGGNRHLIMDLGSANGTWLNGRRISVHRELGTGDEIQIGKSVLSYTAADRPSSNPSGTGMSTTPVDLRTRTCIVMVTDVRDYTAMSEALPDKEFSRMMTRWFRKSSEIIEQNEGTVDKFIGDAVLAYWMIENPDRTREAIESALTSVTKTLGLQKKFSRQLSRRFPDHDFRVGIGLNMGSVMVGDVGAGVLPSFTISGDTVNVAFRLEELTKEKKGQTVILNRNIADDARDSYKFNILGKTMVRGRKEPVPLVALREPFPSPKKK